MSASRKAIEAGKSVLIVLLAASAMLLAWRTGLFNDFFNTIPFFGNVAELMKAATGTVETSGVTLKEAALPLYIVITDEEGGRYGAKYDTDARNAAYDRTSSIMGEALGSASEPREISEEEWRAALSGTGIYFFYVMPVRLSVLTGWLGATMPELPEDAALQHLFIGFGEDRSRIYFIDYVSGVFYGADTASPAVKAQELGIYSANGALFAFETDINASNNAPYMLLMKNSGHPDVSGGAAGSVEDLLGFVLEAMGHTDERPAILPESDGAIRCVGTQFNVWADATGRVTYRRTESLPPTDERPKLSEGEMIEQARVIAASTIGAACGRADVFFESFEYDGGYYTVNFGYYIAGGRVYLHDDINAARVVFLSGMVTDVELNFRTYSLADESTLLLPERQAFAAADGMFMLCYSDSGTETMQPFWH